MSHEDRERHYTLPSSLITRNDLRRLIVELEVVDSELITKSIHERTGHGSGHQLHLSDTLNSLVETNSLDIYHQESRTDLLNQLRHLKDHAPVVHMTFASTPRQDVLSRLVGWLREKIDSQAVINVGLQPGLIGGVHVRTRNKVFDMSIRSQLANSRQAIVDELEALRGV